MKNIFFLPLILWILSVVFVGAQKPKAALVNVQFIFKNHPETIEAQKQINDTRAKIQKEDTQIKENAAQLESRLRLLEQQISLIPNGSKDREPLIADYQQTRTQIQQMLGKRQAISTKQTSSLNKKMGSRADKILKDIHAIIKTKSAELGFDIVFDQSGLNSSQVPFALYVKDGKDITQIILQEINKK